MKTHVWLLIIAGVIFSSCGLLERGTVPWEEGSYNPTGSELTSESDPDIEIAPIEGNLSRSDKEVRKGLEDAYGDWRGVPYLLGGKGRSGIDCSGFMQIVFEDYLDIRLPRTTREQIKVGQQVPKTRIRMGDMVFFKTGRDTWHVGVMVNNQQFLHASTSKGVKISELKNKYWADTYRTTRRITK